MIQRLRETSQLLEHLRAVRAQTRRLADPLSPEDQQVQSMPEASPTKWHLAHTTWFFEEFVLAPFSPDHERFRPDYGYLFNSYYQLVGPMHPRPDRGLLTRPPLEEVLLYRSHVEEALEVLLDRGEAPELELVRLGCQHEQQHQELILTDIKHMLSLNPLLPAYTKRSNDDAVVPNERPWFEVEAGVYEIGHAGGGFAFDNEGPRHKVYLNAFRLAPRPVTNGELLAFVEAGGYRSPKHWLSDGWQRVQDEEWEAPLYWTNREGAWHAFTLAGLRPLDLNAPAVHLSYYEADAYARWAGKRLPTEAEWEVVAAREPIRGNFVESGRLHPTASEAGLFGNVWEWTRSPYSAYPGYRAPEGAVGEYNGKFMCNQFVLRGGSCATPSDHVRSSYRNFFYPHARWQFSGLRLAGDA